jgi:hypothetical protein
VNTHHRIDRRLKGSIRLHRRVGASLAVAAVAAAMLVPGAQAAVPREHAVSSEEYVPFVTDFARPAAQAPTKTAYVPFVTDFPDVSMTASPAAEAGGSGIGWDEAAIGVGVGGALAALLAGSGVVLMRRARPVRS